MPQCMPLVALLTWLRFMLEPHLSGVVRITHFLRGDVVILSVYSRNNIVIDMSTTSLNISNSPSKVQRYANGRTRWDLRGERVVGSKFGDVYNFSLLGGVKRRERWEKSCFVWKKSELLWIWQCLQFLFFQLWVEPLGKKRLWRNQLHSLKSP